MSDTLVQVKNVAKHYHTPHGDVAVLNGITFNLKKGEIVAVTGASGVGKSTLLHIMGGLDRPSGGEIYFKEKPVFQMSERELAVFRNEKIGFVFQFHHLLPEFSAVENVAMPILIRKTVSRKDALNAAREILNEVGLSSRLNHMPSQLSGGEQQRVALARAMVTSPALLLADEPTGNLDTDTGRIVFEVMCNLNRKFQVTFVIATHDMDLARSSQRILRLSAGSVVSDSVVSVETGLHADMPGH
ncbi:MAG: ABC transporter ATP-binding protein [bacterium]